MATTRQVAGLQNSEADIPSSYSRLIARELGLTARQLTKLLRGTGIDTQQFQTGDSLLTSAQQVQILRNALALSGQPDFGLRLGERLTPATHGAMGFAVCSSPDLLTALQTFHKFLPTRASFIHLRLQQVEDHMECLLDFQVQLDQDVARCLAETAVKAFFATGEFIAGRPLDEAEACFAHAAPAYRANYPAYLPGRVYFGCDQLKLRLPMALCRMPNVSANSENYGLALQQCESMLARLQSRDPDYRTRLKKMMLSHPPGTLCEEEAAAALFMSKRTLARKLKQENSGFREIREEILSRQAAGYLRDSQMSVEAIAALMNYHDTASFRRAFKRWFAVPPEQYRQSMGQPSSRTQGVSLNAPMLSKNVLVGVPPSTQPELLQIGIRFGRSRSAASAPALNRKNAHMKADTREYLAPGDFIDSDHPDVQAFARNRAGEGDDRQRAIRLYYAVRDEIRYDPYAFSLEPDLLRASATLAAGRGYCVPKAVLLAACARATGIPARIGLADVKNHLASQRLLALMQTDIFYYHGYTEFWLDGCWVKATPAFNIELCERFGVKALEFDGREHALMHEFDTAGRRHMQYLTDHGPRADLPYAELAAAYRKHYPRLLAAPDALGGDMAAEMEQDRARR